MAYLHEEYLAHGDLRAVSSARGLIRDRVLSLDPAQRPSFR